MSSESSSSIKERQIGEYLIKDLIGAGGFAKVYRGIHIPTKETVAIKIIDKEEIFEDEINRKRLISEISLLKKVRHKNIIKLYEIMETPETIYLVMEYCNNGELFDYIVKKTNLDEKQACAFFQEIIDALSYLHSIKIVHRDIKPENILLNTVNKKINCKIIDFGISRTLENNGPMLATPCGTASYASPEIHRGEKYNGILSEIWSTGVLLYAMVCGYLPFSEEDEHTNTQNILNGCYELPEELSPELKDLLKHLLDVNINTRYTMEKIKNHPWFNLVPNNSRPGVIIDYHRIPIDHRIIQRCESYGYNKDEVYDSIKNNKYDKNSSIYYIILKKFGEEEIESISDLYSNKYLEYINDPNNLLNEEEKIMIRDEMQKDIDLKDDKNKKKRNSIYRESEGKSVGKIFSDESDDDNRNKRKDSNSDDFFSSSDEEEKNVIKKTFLKRSIGFDLDIFNQNDNEKKEEEEKEKENANIKNKNEDKEINTSIIEIEQKEHKEIKEDKRYKKKNKSSFTPNKKNEEAKKFEKQNYENGISKTTLVKNKNRKNIDNNKNTLTNESTPLKSFNNSSDLYKKINNEKMERENKNDSLKLFDGSFNDNIKENILKMRNPKKINQMTNVKILKALKEINNIKNNYKNKNNNHNKYTNNNGIKAMKFAQKPNILSKGKNAHTIIKNRNASVNIQYKKKNININRLTYINEKDKTKYIKNKLSHSVRTNNKIKYIGLKEKKNNAVNFGAFFKKIKIPKNNGYKGEHKTYKNKNNKNYSLRSKSAIKRNSLLKTNEKRKEKEIKENTHKYLNFTVGNTVRIENKNNNNKNNNNYISNNLIVYDDKRTNNKNKNKEMCKSFINNRNKSIEKKSKKKNVFDNQLYDSNYFNDIQKRKTFTKLDNKKNKSVTNQLDIESEKKAKLQKNENLRKTVAIKKIEKIIKIEEVQKFKGPLDTKNLIVSNSVESIHGKICNALNLNQINFWKINPLKYSCCAKNMDKFVIEITLKSKINKKKENNDKKFHKKKYNDEKLNGKTAQNLEAYYLFYLKLLLSKESNHNPNKKLLENIINAIHK